MIERTLKPELLRALATSPAVALLGPRQVGKTTLALDLSEGEIEKEIIYLDLELDSDLAKLDDAEIYLRRLEGRLVIIDEAQRKPDLFRTLRAIIDIRKRQGESATQFLLLGSASRALLQETSESLAGRIRYLELAPLDALEIASKQISQLNLESYWLRGGYPDSYQARDDKDSWDWRTNFINTYLERDIPQMGPNLPATTLKRLWTMLAHNQGQQTNLSALAKSLEKTHPTIRTYLDTLTDFYMLRQLQPWAGNTKKRLVKTPNVYLRDSGLLHALLNIPDIESLLGHPVVGASWEGLVIENIASNLDSRWSSTYYRTSAQAEIDLVLEGPSRQRIAVEIKRSPNRNLSRGYHLACEDINATHKAVIHSGTGNYPMKHNTEAYGLLDFMKFMRSL